MRLPRKSVADIWVICRTTKTRRRRKASGSEAFYLHIQFIFTFFSIINFSLFYAFNRKFSSTFFVFLRFSLVLTSSNIFCSTLFLFFLYFTGARVLLFNERKKRMHKNASLSLRDVSLTKLSPSYTHSAEKNFFPPTAELPVEHVTVMLGAVGNTIRPYQATFANWNSFSVSKSA